MKLALRKPRKLGRRSLYAPALVRRICQLLAKGNTISAVCDAVAVGVATYYEWIDRYPDFAEATMRARGKARVALVKIITDAAKADWRAAGWLLSHCWPQEYSETRPLPEGESPQPRIGVQFVLGGTGKRISFAEAQKRYASNFPVIEEPAPAQVTADNDEDFRYFERHGIVRIRPEHNGDGDET